MPNGPCYQSAPRWPFFVGAVKFHQQLYSTDDSTLLQGSPTIWMLTRGLRLMASCGPIGRHTRPDFEPKVSGSGSQRVPLLTIMSGNGGADAVINGGLNTV